MKNKILLAVFVALGFSAHVSGAAYFLKEGGTGDALTPQTPNGSINNVFSKINPQGGDTIVVCGDFGLSANFTERAHSGEVVITQMYDGIDYRKNEDESINSFYDKGDGRRYILNGPTKFENINFGKTGSKYILFIANYFPITMDEGINTHGYQSTNLITSLSIVGGYQGTNTAGDKNLDSKITIKSGKFLLIGFNRDEKSGALYTGTARVNILGGEIVDVFGGSTNVGSTKGGDLDLNISDGKILGTIYAGHFTGINNLGVVNSNVKITGGDFSECKGIVGLVAEEGIAEGGVSLIDFCSHPEKKHIETLVSGFTTIKECFVTSINEMIKGEGLVVRIDRKAMTVTKDDLEELSVFGMNGCIIYQGFNSSVELPSAGVYAIRVNEIVKKIVVH